MSLEDPKADPIKMSNTEHVGLISYENEYGLDMMLSSSTESSLSVCNALSNKVKSIIQVSGYNSGLELGNLYHVTGSVVLSVLAQADSIFLTLINVQTF